MPPRDKRPCNCTKCMAGGRREPTYVSQSTWRDHAPFRISEQPQITPFNDFLATFGSVPPPTNPSPAAHHSTNPPASPQDPRTSRSPPVEQSHKRPRLPHGAQPKHDRKSSSHYRDRSSSRYRSRSPNYDSHSRHVYSRRRDTSGDRTACNERYEQLEGKYTALKAKYAELNTAHTTLNKVHEALTQAIGTHVANGRSSSSSPPSLPPHDLTLNLPEKYRGLNRENGSTRFPLIKFWTQDDFSKGQKQKHDDVLDSTKDKPRRGNARLKEGENVSCRYMEQEDGSIIDGHGAEEIRKHLKLVYKQLGSQLPETWGKVGIVQRAYVLNELYKKYPYLALCYNDWKADFLASRGLSSFRSTEKRRSARSEATVETEVKIQDDDALPLTDEKINAKRKASAHEPGPMDSKRPRLTPGSSDSPPSLPRRTAPLNSTSAQPLAL